MRTKILASLAIATAMFTACSETTTTPPPTKAEQCAAGLTSDCIMGTWSISGPTIPSIVGTDTVYLVDQNHNYASSPATLKFYVDEKKGNKFEFVESPLAKGCKSATGKMYGDWSITGTSLTLYAGIGSDCIETSKNRTTLTPIISVNGANVKMTFKQIFFMIPELDGEDAVIKAVASEEYNFVSAD